MIVYLDIMFKDIKAFSGFSVDDLQQAKGFYGSILALNLTESTEMPGLLTLHIASGADILVYAKHNHVPATYTILNFPVPDITLAVQQLNSSGVRFEHYDFENFKTDADGVFRAGGPLIAWFKDPAGNILSVIEQKAD
jgi:catechol 2,3-dioxygenase-like lactoylglutathione lyase family enzyme